MSLQYPQKLDLDKLEVFEELSYETQDLFNIDNLPNILTLGKHYFTISFNNSKSTDLSLKLSSQVLFEFKDSQDNLIFSDITNYDFQFLISNLKLVPGDYEVSVSSKLISHWKCINNNPVEYWIALEKSSTYNN